MCERQTELFYSVKSSVKVTSFNLLKNKTMHMSMHKIFFIISTICLTLDYAYTDNESKKFMFLIYHKNVKLEIKTFYLQLINYITSIRALFVGTIITIIILCF